MYEKPDPLSRIINEGGYITIPKTVWDVTKPYSRMHAWVLDMIRALNEIPAERREMLREIMGPHAYRELVGLVETMIDIESKDMLNFDYCLEDIDYHQDDVPDDIADLYREE